ncbi:hypothetical protein [Mycoplasma putrefaciens]|nr:hypothetical protein [Mycoplasma putrefaciens]
MQLNLNFRELQPEYIDNIRKRNTQIRINLKWFVNNYFEDLKKINIYKASIITSQKELIDKLKIATNFNNSFI